MKTFKDTVTNKIYSFEDDVIVSTNAGRYSFSSPDGTLLVMPNTLQPYTIPSPDPTILQNQQINNYAGALTTAINNVAQLWQYDSIYTAATYLNSSITIFAHEAAALVTWRDQAWNNAQILLAQVNAKTATMPATAQDFLTMVLPPTPTRPTS
jgi:hypothetical protein